MTAKHNYHRWTETDIAFLEKWWGIKTVSDIARKLKRTPKAVTVTANRRKLGSRLETRDGITLFVLLKELHSGCRKPNQKDYKFFLASGAPYFTVYSDKRRYYMVNIDKFWQWAEHQNVYDLSKIEPLSLGKEPDWMYEYRKQKGLELANKRWEGCA